jgi:hypothetical protein
VIAGGDRACNEANRQIVRDVVDNRGRNANPPRGSNCRLRHCIVQNIAKTPDNPGLHQRFHHRE